jgi:hypothetical protein
MRIRITFTEEILGTASANPEIHKEFIASKAPDAKSMEEEVESVGVDSVVEKAMTVFPREEGKPFLWDYQIKGFFKDACSMLRKVPKTKSSELTAYKKVIDGLVFPKPRKIIIEGGEIGYCQRPLRGQTARGERIALANSETMPAGSYIEFEILLLKKDLQKLVEEWLDYGELRGIGQWRNSGKGRFTWEAIA